MKTLLKKILARYSEKRTHKKQKLEWLKGIAEKKSLELQKLSYEELCFFMDEPWTDEYGEGDSFHQLEVMVDYDDPERVNKNLRVIVCVDDGGIRAFVPYSCDFIITPEGEFL